MDQKDGTLTLAQVVKAAQEALTAGDFTRANELARYAAKLAKAQEGPKGVPQDIMEAAGSIIKGLNPVKTLGKVDSGDHKGAPKTARQLFDSKRGVGVYKDPITGDVFGLSLINVSETTRRSEAHKAAPVVNVAANGADVQDESEQASE